MRRSSLALPAVAGLVLTTGLLPSAGGAASAAPASHRAVHRAGHPAYTVTTLHFRVTVPDESVGGSGTQTCTIVGDLYKPRTATARHRVPVILTTNGFGGSKDDQAATGRYAAHHGYGVLSYSGLGFGGSGCKISLDDPSYDGRAGSQLIDFLGGKKGIATTTDGKAFPAVRWIRHDRRDHRGHARRYDPRVGTIGGSYGGEFQFAIAGRDARLDTMIPIITWNDLSYSLAPNDSGFTHGVTYATRAPGIEKMDWVDLFFGVGIADGAMGSQVDPARNAGCPNFLTPACKAKAELDSNAFSTPDLFGFARHASVESYLRHVRIPTLLAQGQGDTLFNLQEATATYQALRHRHVPVKMIWQSWGHSTSTPAPGELALGAGARHTYEGRRFFDWFDHYLKGKRVGTGPRFAYYRDWVHYSGKGPDTAQYGTSSRVPTGHRRTLFGSGSGSLVAHRSAVKAGSQSYSNTGGGTPTSYSETSAVDQSKPVTDGPGTFASFRSAPLKHRVDVAGMPSATLHLSAPDTASAPQSAQLEMFVKLYDIAPDGTITLVHRLIAPVRVFDASKPVHVQLPGIVHRFAKGHRFELVMAASDAAYRNSSAPQPVTVLTSKAHPVVLTLPVVR